MKNIQIVFLCALLLWGVSGAMADSVPSISNQVSISDPVLVSKDYQVTEAPADVLVWSTAKAGERVDMTFRGADHKGVPYNKVKIYKGGEKVLRWKISGKIAQDASCLNVVPQPEKTRTRSFLYERTKTVTIPGEDNYIPYEVEVPVEKPTYFALMMAPPPATQPQAVVGGNFSSSQIGCIGVALGGRGGNTTFNVNAVGGNGYGAAAAAAAAASTSTSTAVTPTSGAAADQGATSGSSGASP